MSGQPNSKYIFALVGIILLFCLQILLFRFAINPLITQDWFVRQCLSTVPYLDKFEIAQMYAQGAVSNEKPPLFFLAGAALYRLLGSSPQNIYWLNVLFSAALLWLTYLIGTTVFKDRKSGMFAALVLALTPNFIMQSREVTMELMLAVVVCLGIWILAKTYPTLQVKHIAGIALLAVVATMIRKFGLLFFAGPFIAMALIRMGKNAATQKTNQEIGQLTNIPVKIWAVLLGIGTACALGLNALIGISERIFSDNTEASDLAGFPLPFESCFDLTLTALILVWVFHWFAKKSNKSGHQLLPAIFVLIVIAANLTLLGIRFGLFFYGFDALREAAEQYRTMRTAGMKEPIGQSGLPFAALAVAAFSFNVPIVLYWRRVRKSLSSIRRSFANLVEATNNFSLQPVKALILISFLSGTVFILWYFLTAAPARTVGNVIYHAAYDPFTLIRLLTAILAPMAPFLIVVFIRALKQVRIEDRVWILIAWILCPLIFFGFVVYSRFAEHSLPLLPAMAVLVGRGFVKLGETDAGKKNYLLLILAAGYAFVAATIPGLTDNIFTRVLMAPQMHIQALTDTKSLPKPGAGEKDFVEMIRSIRNTVKSDPDNNALFIDNTAKIVPRVTPDHFFVYLDAPHKKGQLRRAGFLVGDEAMNLTHYYKYILVRSPSNTYKKIVGEGYQEVESFPMRVHWAGAAAIAFTENDLWHPSRYRKIKFHLMTK